MEALRIYPVMLNWLAIVFRRWLGGGVCRKDRRMSGGDSSSSLLLMYVINEI
jgi:hypothetical protein